MCLSTCQRTGLQSQKAQGMLLALFKGPLQKDLTGLQPWLGLIMLLAQPARKSDLLVQHDQKANCRSLHHSAEHAWLVVQSCKQES